MSSDEINPYQSPLEKNLVPAPRPPAPGMAQVFLTGVGLGCGSFVAAIALIPSNVPTLAEILRRGDPKFLAELQRRYEACQRERVQASKATPPLRKSENYELLLLSALHRAKKLPDPVPVVINGNAKREIMFPEMRVFDVAVLNRHPEHREVTWQGGVSLHALLGPNTISSAGYACIILSSSSASKNSARRASLAAFPFPFAPGEEAPEIRR